MNRNKSQFIGLFIVLFALSQLAGLFNIVGSEYLAIGLGVIAASFGLYSYAYKNFYVGSWSLAIALLYTYPLIPLLSDIKELSLWSLFLISTILGFGLELIFGKKKRSKKYTYTSSTNTNQHNHFDAEYKTTYVDDEHFESTTENIDNEEYVFIDAKLGDHTRYIYSTNLKEVNINTKLGQTNVYFQERTLNNDLNVYVSCKMAEVNIYVPREWRIKDNVSVTLADFNYGYRSSDDASNLSDYTVYLTGNITLGNINIHYV